MTVNAAECGNTTTESILLEKEVQFPVAYKS